MELKSFSRSHWMVGAALLLVVTPTFAQQPSGVSESGTQQGGSAAPAPPSDRDLQEAKERFKRAVELYEEGDYAASLIEFRKAYQLAPTYKLHYKIGQVAYKLKDYAAALRAFQAYLREGGDAIPPKRRKEVEEEIRILKSQTGYLSIQCNEAGAMVSIDDKPVGKTPLDHPVLVSIGKRKISITKPGRAPVTRVVDVAGEEVETVNVRLVKLVGETRTIIKTTRTPSKVTGWTWAGIAGAGLLGAAAGVTGILATNASEDLSNMTFAGDNPTQDIKDQQDKTRNLALATDVLAGASIVTLATTLIWTFARPTPAPKSSPMVDKKNKKMSRSGVFVTPVVGMGQFGIKGGF